MKITEKDLETITKFQRKYKFFKGLTTNEIVDLYLRRCENCEELCFGVDLIPIPNFKGEVYKVCESCSSELLQENPNVDDRYLQYLEDRQKAEW